MLGSMPECSNVQIEYIEHDKLQMIILKVAYCIYLLTLNKSKKKNSSLTFVMFERCQKSLETASVRRKKGEE